MRIIGIDPGSRFLGFGVIEYQSGVYKPVEYGTLKFNSDDNLTRRLLQVGDEIEDLFKTYQADQLAIEKIFLGKNADSAFKLGHVRGVVLYHALKQGMETFEYATRSVKKGVTGNGGAEKDHVRMVIQKILNIPTVKSLDASDALALACYHAQQIKIIGMKRQAKSGLEL